MQCIGTLISGHIHTL